MFKTEPSIEMHEAGAEQNATRIAQRALGARSGQVHVDPPNLPPV